METPNPLPSQIKLHNPLHVGIVAVQEGADYRGVPIPGSNNKGGGGLLPICVESVHQAAPGDTHKSHLIH